MYEKYSYLCISAFCISILCFIFTPEKGMKVYVPEVSAKEFTTATGKTKTGVSMEIPTWGKENSKKEWKWNSESTYKEYAVSSWSNATSNCDAECKTKELITRGIRDEIAHALVDSCKEQDIEVVNCIKLWASIVVAESWWWSRCNKNWCFWILVKWLSYKTKEEWVRDWVKRFWKYWKNQKTPDSFYSNSPKWNPKTRYCMSERQPDWTMLSYCKNWHKHAWNIFNKLEKLF